jgi:hypothetical protein
MIKPKMGDAPTGRGISCIGKMFVAQPLTSPVITAILDLHTPTGCPSCPIVTILENVVT